MTAARTWTWRTVVAATALLSAAAVVAVSAPTTDQVQDPIEVRGVLGQRIQARTAEVQVHGVRAARTVELTDGRSVATPGVWLVLDVTVGCRLTACSFDASELRTGGHVYLPSPAGSAASFRSLGGSPGLRYRTTALFEVPRSVLGDPRAVLVVNTTGTFVALDGVPAVRLAIPATAVASAPVGGATVVGAS